MNYYYRDKSGQEIGPLSLTTLAQLRFAGVLNDDTPMRSADSEQWMACSKLVAAPSAPAPTQLVVAGTEKKTPFSPVLIVLIIVGAIGYGGMALYKKIAVTTALAYEFTVDGKALPTGQTPEVKVDGQPSWSGNKIKPGRHQISVHLENVEPYERHFWVFYGTKDFGALPLESSKGTLAVTVNPSPATVIVRCAGSRNLVFILGENVREGVAPLNERLPVGDYTLFIRRGEYAENHPVKIQRNLQTDARIDLKLGNVDLSSDPPDAEFELSDNGRSWQGKLPTRIDDVPVGTYRLSARRKGWELKAEVSVSRGSIATNKTEFPYGSIEVTSEPSGLAIATNGVEIGKTPIIIGELRPGHYKVTATDGENDLFETISVGPKEKAKKAFAFRYGTVRLASTPPGAAVIRRGKDVGKTPLMLERIPAGDTSVELRLAGYVSTNFPLRVQQTPSIRSQSRH